MRALEGIARRAGVSRVTMKKYAALVDGGSVGFEAEQGNDDHDGRVTAKWLASILLAMAIGDSDGLVQKYNLLKEARLESVFSLHENFFKTVGEYGCVSVDKKIIDRSDIDPRKYYLKGSKLTELLEQLISWVPGCPDKIFGNGYTGFDVIEITWLDGMPSIRLQTCEPGWNVGVFPKVGIITMEFVYGVDTTSDVARAKGVAQGIADASIPRDTRLRPVHIEMLASILVETRIIRSAAKVH